MLSGRKYASKIDIKLGTSTCSASILDDPEKLRKRVILDKETTSHTLGFNIGGMSLKDPTSGKPRDIGKLGLDDSCKDRAEAKERLRLFFKYQDGYDMALLNYVISELKKLLQYLEHDNNHVIRGMSIFIVADSAQKSYELKLIDLVSIEPLADYLKRGIDDDTKERDEGSIFGVKTLLEILSEIKKEESSCTLF